MSFVRPPTRRFRHWMALAPPAVALAMVPVAWLCSRLGCYDELQTCMVPAFVLLPLLTLAFPSTRRRGGGCLLGMFTWVLTMAVLGVIQPYLPQPVAGFILDGYRITVCSVALGEPRPEVEHSLGAGRLTLERPDRQVYDYGGEVTVQYGPGDRVDWVSGPSLERNGSRLLYRGVPRRLMAQVFPERGYTTSTAVYELRSRAGQFDTVTMHLPGRADSRFQPSNGAGS